MFSLTYPSLALSVLQRPCFLNNLFSTFAAAAAVAPHDLRLFSPKYFLLRPKISKADNRNSLAIV